MSKKKKNNPPVLQKPVAASAVTAKPPQQKSPFLNEKLWMLALPLLAFLIYANTLNHDFALDDVAVIQQNKFVQKGFAGFPELLKTFYWQGYWNANAGLYRPMSMLMFAAEWQFSHSDKFPAGNPFLYHFINVFLYAISVFFLFKLLLKLFSKENILLSVIAALIFIVHPYHTEVVSNIKSRDEILCFLFFTLSGIFLLKSIESRQLKHKIASAVFLFLSLFSKEGGALFLPVLALMAAMFKNIEWKKLPDYLLPHVLIFTGWLALHEYVIRSSEFARITYSYLDNSLFATESFLSRELTAVGMLGRYIVKSVFPYQVSYDYSFPVIPNETGIGFWPLCGFLFSGLLLFFALKYFRKRPVIAFSILFFLVTISLTCNVFIKIGATMADRFLFVPSLGIAILISWLVISFLKKNRAALSPLILAAPLLIFYSFKTVQRNADWKNDDTLFSGDVISSPNSSRTQYNMGVKFQSLGMAAGSNEEKKQALETAINYYKKSAELDPLAFSSWGNLGASYFHDSLYRESVSATRAAISAMEKLKQDPAMYFGNLGDAYFKLNMFDSCIYFEELAIEKNFSHRSSIAYIGFSWFSKKNYEKALESFDKGLSQDSLNSELWLNKGNTLGMLGRYPEAISAFEKSHSLNNQNLQALYFIAMTYERMGDIASAKKYLEMFNAQKQKPGK